MCGAHALLVAAPVLLGTALAAEPNFPITPQMRGTAQQVAQAGALRLSKPFTAAAVRQIVQQAFQALPG